jgi:hypothetical protein
MKEITTNQVCDILGISYPTALRFAQKHGRKVDRADSPPAWVVPVSVVDDYINDRLAAARAMRDRRVAVTG